MYAAFVQCGSWIARPHRARPWQNGVVESIRLESLDHLIVFAEA